MADGAAFLVTCEHGGCELPPDYAGLFFGAEEIVESHRGWDAGALEAASKLAALLAAPLFSATVSRLVVDCNRSLANNRLFSEWTRDLSPAVKASILAVHYHPHREAVRAAVADFAARGVVIHLAIHSFTPVLAGETRRADLGLLYDPARELEKEFCARTMAALRQSRPGLAVRRNYPYLGVSDGLATALRREFPADRYIGIEIELNQRLLVAGGVFPDELIDRLAEAFILSGSLA